MAKDKDCRTIAERIIKEMKHVIGDVALTLAGRVKGLRIDSSKISFQDEPNKVIERLIGTYESLIGPVARTIAKRGLQGMKKSHIPKVLQ